MAVIGERRLPIFHVDQLRAFLGLPAGQDTAAYQALVAALERVLEGVERAVRSVPDRHVGSPTPNRGRDLRELVFNIHDPIGLMRDGLDTLQFDWQPEADFERSRHFESIAQLAGFCRQTRLSWFERASVASDDDAAKLVWTPRGELTQLQVLDAQANHAARHLRQIYVFLREIGIEPVQEMTAEQMAPIDIGEAVF